MVFLSCALCQLLAWRVRMPPILFLLLTGILAGPVLGLIKPEKMLGDLFHPFVSLSVAIILFEGSLNLKIREIRGLHSVVRNMVSFGMLATWLITTLATRLIFGISWEVSTLFGAIMVVTGPTVVAPILRTVRPVSSISNILKWESIVIDPIGATLAVLVFEFIVIGEGQDALGHTLTTFSHLLFIGSLIGFMVGYFFALSLRYHLIPEYLHNICALGLVFASYALADHFQPESGLVTVTVFGVLLANMKDVDLEHILAFKETLSILLISLLFIILAARIDFADLRQLGWNALLICLVLQFLARPLCIKIASIGSTLSSSEKHFMAWIAPRGIVAAAISSLFALKLESYGHGDAKLLVPLTFTIIIFTVLLQSLTAGPIARFLKVTLPDSDGFLIIGSNRLSRAIAKALLSANCNLMLGDSTVERLAEAKRAGIPTYTGNPLSELANHNLELVGVGSLLALSSSESENMAATLHYRREFGKNNIYSILSAPRKFSAETTMKSGPAPQLPGKTLFSEEVSYQTLIDMMDHGATVQCQNLEGRLEPNVVDEKYGRDTVILFGIDPSNKVHCVTTDNSLTLDKDWQIVFLG